MKLSTAIVGCIALGVTMLMAMPNLEADTMNLPEAYNSEPVYPVDTLDLSGEDTEAICLAKNIYFEAGNQELAGKYAVSHVVFNRVDSFDFPDTVCEVIYQAQTRPSWQNENVRVPIRNKCQFSWYCDGKPDDPVGENWEISLNIAIDMLEERRNNLGVDITDGALYYHANYVKPYWAKTMRVVARIGDHIFYR